MRKTFFVLSFLLMSSLALAAIPKYITVQGRLTDSNNVPVLSGSYLFNFTIWNDPTAGTLIWTDQFNAPVSNGVFNIELGRNVPLNILFDQPYFLEIRVGGNLLTPRVNFTSAPYAFTSASGSGGSGNVSGAGLANKLAIWKDAGNITYDSSIHWDSVNNRLGIGTSSPEEKLHIVNDSTGSDIYMKIQATTGGNAGIKLQRGSASDGFTDYNIYVSAGDFYIDRSNSGSSSTRLFIDDNTGNVGIGTISPSHALNIIGGLNVTSPAFFGGSVSLTGSNLLMNSNNILNVNQINGIAVSNFLTTSTSFSGNVTGTSSNLNLAANSVDSAKIVDSSVASADVGFNYAGSSSKGGAASSLSCSGCVNLTTEVTDSLPISNGGTGATTAANARTNLGAAMTGSCPGQAIQNVTANSVQCVAIGGGGGGNGWTTSGNYIYNATTAGVGIGTSNPSAMLEVSGISSAGLSFNASNILYVNGSSGSVGINTANPAVDLDVNGYINATRVYIGSSRYFDFNPNGGWIRTSASFDMQNIYYIRGASRIGVGTMSPNAELEINGTSATNGLSFNASNILIVNGTNGNVGIGTTSPTQKLEVAGGVRLYNTTAKPACDAANGPTIRGTLWFTNGGTGADILEVCAKNATAYAWRKFTWTPN